MKKRILKERALAVQRYLAGESPENICNSLGKTKPWLYKWVAGHTTLMIQHGLKINPGVLFPAHTASLQGSKRS